MQPSLLIEILSRKPKIILLFFYDKLGLTKRRVVRLPNHSAITSHHSLRRTQMVILVVIHMPIHRALTQRFGHPGFIGFDLEFFVWVPWAAISARQPSSVDHTIGGAAVNGLFVRRASGLLAVSQTKKHPP